MNDIFAQLRTDLGSVPGKAVITSISNLFQQLLLPKLKLYLKNKGLQNQMKGSLRDCYNTTTCQNFLKKAMSFRMATMTIYPVLTNQTDLFLSQRPDFYLGRFLSMFTENLTYQSQPCLQFEGLNAQIANLVSEQLTGIMATYMGCSDSLDKIMMADYQTFVDIVKFSQVRPW